MKFILGRKVGMTQVFLDSGAVVPVTRAIADQARTIRIPVHMIETINKLNRISRQILQEKYIILLRCHSATIRRRNRTIRWKTGSNSI